LDPLWVSTFITIVLVTITAYYASATKKIAYATEKNVWQQALLQLQKEYGTPDMMDSIRHLWHFFRSHCNEDEIRLRKEFRNLIEKNINPDINSSRRKTIVFYLHLAVMNNHDILSKDILFDMFTKRDLEIIPKILIPLEEEYQDYIDELDNRKKMGLSHKNILLKLYNDSINRRY
jgi:hypothetical protein